MGRAKGSLLERLGRPRDARLIIVNCDDFGSSIDANTAILEVLGTGAATSTTWMAPCQAADVAAQSAGDHDVGVHLTLNSEWDELRWGPIGGASSLTRDDGTFWSRTNETWARASLDDVRAECRAQIRRSIALGLDPTHLDSHMNVMMKEVRFGRILVDLGAEFELPIRIPERIDLRRRRDIWDPRHRPSATRAYARRRRVVAPDRFADAPIGAREANEAALANLLPGVTELLAHPALDSEELRATHADWEGRVDDHDYLANGAFDAAVAAVGAERIGYRLLRDLQRSDA